MHPHGGECGRNGACGTLCRYGLVFDRVGSDIHVNLALGTVTPIFKNCYRALIGIIMIAAWATIGNFTYGVPYNFGDGDPHFDWFFLTGSTFPFIPAALMPVLVICAVFLMVLIIYGIYFLVKRIARARATDEPQEAKEEAAV